MILGNSIFHLLKGGYRVSDVEAQGLGYASVRFRIFERFGL